MENFRASDVAVTPPELAIECSIAGVEVFSQQRVLVMDNWRKLTGYGFRNFKAMSSAQDKGHANQFRLFVERIQKGGHALIPFSELVNTTRASFGAIESMKQSAWVEIH